MEPRFEDIAELSEELKSGYVANGRTTTANDRLIFILVLMILTKRSIPHVLSLRKNQFKIVNNKCILRDISPRAQNVYRIEFPIAFYQYLESYCKKYVIAPDEQLFILNSEYVGNRFRELIKIRQKSFSTRDIQTMIPYGYNTSKYKMKMEKYLSLFITEKESCYFSRTGMEMANIIELFMQNCLNHTKLS